MKNAELEELNRIHYEVTADQNLKIQDLKALNAELLEALKECRSIFLAQLDQDEAYFKRIESAIAKAENK